MQSKWFHKKEKALLLRQSGNSIRDIEVKLGIPRSTLSGWFKDIKISKKHQDQLRKRWERGLVEARKKATQWHKNEKEKRIAHAQKEAEEVFEKIDTTQETFLELSLALLYLGEGSKRNGETALGNSDPFVLKFFIASLRKLYRIEDSQIRCELNIRADQDPDTIKHYWSQQLKLPLKNFTTVSKDLRTKGSKTYSYYKGVCHVRCGNIHIQRRLKHLFNRYCNKVIDNYL
ncbi:MAG: hypothetical protein WDZ82_03535 [Candidatus Paceibacterota bacterium]